MNIRTVFFWMATVAAASPVFSDEVDFPLESGDISLSENWGGTFPASTDTIKLQGNGPYTISRDIETFGLIAHSASPQLTVADGVRVSIGNAQGKDGLEFRANSIVGAKITGGFFHMLNKANCEVLFGRYNGSTVPGATATLSSVTVTNANYFIATRHFSDATLTVADESKIYSEYGKISQWKTYSGWGNTMKMTGGSEWHVNSHFYFESLEEPEDGGVWGGSVLDISDPGSLVSVGADMIMGYAGLSNKVHVSDSACLNVDGILNVGGVSSASSGYGGNSLEFENSSTGTFTTVSLGFRSGASDNVFSVASGSYVSVNSLTVGNQSSGNTLVVDSATLDLVKSMTVGNSKNTDATGNTVILRGKSCRINNRDGSGQWIYAANDSTFRFEVPEEGYDDIPIKGSHFQWNGNVTFEVECKKFRNAGGGDIVLVEAGADTWIDQDTDGNLAKCLAKLNETQPEGCSFEIKGKQVIYHASYLPPVRMRIIIR